MEGYEKEQQMHYFMVDAKVLPEVFLKVVEAKQALEAGDVKTVLAATRLVGVSRSAYYRYKDSIFPIYDNLKGRTITIAINLNNASGVLSNVLNAIAKEKANILTINQNIPLNNVANVTITLETGQLVKNFNELTKVLLEIEGVNNIKIIARE